MAEIIHTVFHPVRDDLGAFEVRFWLPPGRAVDVGGGLAVCLQGVAGTGRPRLEAITCGTHWRETRPLELGQALDLRDFGAAVLLPRAIELDDAGRVRRVLVDGFCPAAEVVHA